MEDLRRDMSSDKIRRSEFWGMGNNAATVCRLREGKYSKYRNALSQFSIYN
jgi:hypothetical protein